MAAKKKSPNFETSLEELENLVESLEKGDLSLEASLQKFEQGVKLTRVCQQTLNEAEQKVKILIEQNGQTDLKDYSEQ